MAWIRNQGIAELLYVEDTSLEYIFQKLNRSPQEPESHLYILMYYINPYNMLSGFLVGGGEGLYKEKTIFHWNLYQNL